jgi:hypothetical protein
MMKMNDEFDNDMRSGVGMKPLKTGWSNWI